MQISYEEINQHRTVVEFKIEDLKEILFKEVSRIRNISYPPKDKIDFDLKFKPETEYNGGPVAIITVIDNIGLRQLKENNGK